MGELEEDNLENNNDKPVDRRKTMPHLFKPGQSGNPAGRPPKVRFLSESIPAELDKVPEHVNGKLNKENKTWRVLVIEGLLNGASRGEGAALRELFDRLEGKVVDQVEISGQLEGATKISFISVNFTGKSCPHCGSFLDYHQGKLELTDAKLLTDG